VKDWQSGLLSDYATRVTASPGCRRFGWIQSLAMSRRLALALVSHFRITSSSECFSGEMMAWQYLKHAPSRGGVSVLVTRVDPLQEKPIHGRVILRTTTQLRVSFQKLFDLKGQLWR